jgi:hypothetical protein
LLGFIWGKSKYGSKNQEWIFLYDLSHIPVSREFWCC